MLPSEVEPDVAINAEWLAGGSVALITRRLIVVLDQGCENRIVATSVLLGPSACPWMWLEGSLACSDAQLRARRTPQLSDRAL